MTYRLPHFATVRKLLSTLGRHEFEALLAFVVLAGGAYTFLELASEVTNGETTSIDEQLLLSLRNPADLSDPIGPRWVEEGMRDFTALGGSALLTLFSFAVVTHLGLRRKPKAAAFVAVCVTCGLVLSLTLKHAFARPRPSLVPQLSHVMTSSFPSGHSMLSASVYLTLGALLARFESSLWLKTHLLLWALVLTILVGVSRVYLGVHWPTDVLAGWAAGASWAALCWIFARVLQRRGRVEGEQSREVSSATPSS